VLLLASGLLGCGGKDEPMFEFPDSGTAAITCNPVSQTGCEADEKCSWLTVSRDPYLGRTACVPDGAVPVDGACETGEPGEETGFDDCVAGSICNYGICRSICSISPDSCGDGFACGRYSRLFTDDSARNIGECDPTCDPLAQGCEEGFGCYLQLSTGVATCTGAPVEELTQGDRCLAPEGEAGCYLNGCSPGWASVPFWLMGEQALCTAYCEPVSTWVEDPEGDGVDTTVMGDADGTDEYPCSVERIGAVGQQCRYFNSISFQDGFLDQVDDRFGWCAEPTHELYGDCTKYNLARMVRIYDDELASENGTAMTAAAARDAYCDENGGACPVAFQCLHLGVVEEIRARYCAALPGQASCQSSAQRMLFWKSLDDYHREKLRKLQAEASR
jgi:hypothetical protein